ncbi:MAG TPA: arginase family protein, partial [Phycisphaerales bacterium]|nr:arginase family protein [Phycisphaerales bacterium]
TIRQSILRIRSRTWGGATAEDRADLDDIDATGTRVEEIVRGFASSALREGKVPGVIGGEHAVSLGAIRASAAGGEVGVLQVDAHMDFRESFEGFRWSHASVMYNAMTTTPGVAVIVQVGIRDFGASEAAFGQSLGERCRTHFDEDWKDRLASGERYLDLCRRAIEPLPGRVHVSFDIDGLDPCLCPHTGTPVPGGLSFHEAVTLLHAVRESGRRIVGFDLVEVAPGPDPAEPDWDANVGARLLYKMCGAAGA